ncbi:MAG: hypothetical protein HKO62_08040, partial [Gammaproteobacteria bacterium]|nr:hypothetical protein [Gammaproteobacteria bacterium]
MTEVNASGGAPTNADPATPADELWEQLSTLTPKLRAHATVQLHTYRGTPWCVINDRASPRHFR